MRKVIWLSFIMLLFAGLGTGFLYKGELAARGKEVALNKPLREGDIIFQASGSGQSRAIQLATGSTYSHCGILYEEKDGWYVFEAIQPVCATPLEQWIKRGDNGHYVVKRLKDASQQLDEQTLAKMKDAGKLFNGKNYDLTFEWSDDRIYCSELVWKIYKRAAGIELCTPERFGDFDLSSSEVKKILTQRYGNSVPLDEQVVTPAALFNSDLLITVKTN